MHVMQRTELAVAATFLSVIAAGCSSGPVKGEVKGKVTFEGKAVTEGFITFLNPKEGGGGEAQIKADGTYEVRGGLVVKEYLVTISPPMIMQNNDPKTPEVPVEKPAPNIPIRYRQQGTTTLKAKVEQKKNEINFEMTK